MSRTAIHSVKPITGGRFDEMLNILPPLNWHGLGTSGESFRLSEMLTNDTVAIFVRIGSPWPEPRFFELVAGDQVTHEMAVAFCQGLTQPEAVV